MERLEDLKPTTARRVFLWQMAFFAVLLIVVATSNLFTEIADRANEGIRLAAWEPATWEFSSVVCVWLLIPALGWWLRQFPLIHTGWLRDLPAHLIGTLPFSLAHVAGMVALRDLVYRLMGAHYDFGPGGSSWFYEYRKDFVSYWLLLLGIMAFRLYGLWSDSREAAATGLPESLAAPAAQSSPQAAADESPLERLVVRKLNREYLLNITDIDHIEAEGNYVRVHAQGTTYPRRESLVALEKKLDQKRFVRVHRAHLVNVDRIREIQPWDHGDYRILLQDGSCVNLSRRYRSRLEHLFR
jgi:hypothetical protein